MSSQSPFANSNNRLDGYRTASVLGYCLLPMVLLSVIQVIVPIEYAFARFIDGIN